MAVKRMMIGQPSILIQPGRLAGRLVSPTYLTIVAADESGYKPCSVPNPHIYEGLSSPTSLACSLFLSYSQASIDHLSSITVSLPHDMAYLWPDAWPLPQYLFAYAMPLFFLMVFVRSLNEESARSMCDDVCFPQPRDKPLNAFFYLMTQRHLAFALIFILLIQDGNWRAVTVVTGTLSLCGVRDTWLAATYGRGGWKGAIQAHGIMTVLAILATGGMWWDQFVAPSCQCFTMLNRTAGK